MRTTELPEPTKCPKCEKELTDATGMTHDERPWEGDFTVCIGCTAVLVFGEKLKLRAATAAELAELSPAHALEIARIQTAMRQMRATFN